MLTVWRSLTFGLTLSLLLWGFTSTALAIALPENGAQIFEVHCAGCHAGGGNIVRRGKNLKLKALEKNGYSTTAAIVELVTHGKANMSAYRDRLSPDEIQAVAAYVLKQAQNGWQKSPNVDH